MMYALVLAGHHVPQKFLDTDTLTSFTSLPNNQVERIVYLKQAMAEFGSMVKEHNIPAAMQMIQSLAMIQACQPVPLDRLYLPLSYRNA